MPSVSVIIPVYNRRELAQRAVQSVLAQSYRDFELVIVDDGSTDGFCASDITRCTPVHQRFLHYPFRRGVSAARNSGAAAAQGPWLAFLDSDDQWHTLKLERQMQWLTENPGYRIAQTREIWIRGDKRVNPPKTHKKIEGYIFSESLKRCMITPSSVIMQKSLFREMGGFNESLPACEDYDLWLKIAAQHAVGLIDEYLLTRFGGRADQLSAATPLLDRFRIRTLLDLLAGGRLNSGQKTLVRRELALKANIVAQGCKKRNKEHEYQQYAALAERFIGG
jgi:glycosyltransferase involved in cell wall biosynthesis